MRTLSLTGTLGLLLCLNVHTQAQGIDFVHDTSLVQLKKRAREMNRPIFIDCYTTWCGPCKWMAKNIFPNDTVGQFFNANFISAKIDMEKGDGLNIAKKYKINSYPTFLYLDTAGREIHRVLGSQPAKDFIANSKNAVDSENNFSALAKKYKSGERSTEFLRKYILVADAAGEDVQVLVDWYIATLTQNQLTEPDNFIFLTKVAYFVRAPVFEKLYANRAGYIKKYGLAEVSNFIKSYLEREVSNCYEMRETAPGSKRFKYYELPEKYSAYLEKLKSMEFDGKEKFVEQIELNNMRLREDVGQLLAYYKSHPTSDSDELNSIAWMAYEKSDNPEELKQALQFSKKSVELDESYANTDTYASLLYKLGKKKEAQKYAEKAIELAKKENQDAAATIELLSKIKAMK